MAGRFTRNAQTAAVPRPWSTSADSASQASPLHHEARKLPGAGEVALAPLPCRGNDLTVSLLHFTYVTSSS